MGGKWPNFGVPLSLKSLRRFLTSGLDTPLPNLKKNLEYHKQKDCKLYLKNVCSKTHCSYFNSTARCCSWARLAHPSYYSPEEGAHFCLVSDLCSRTLLFSYSCNCCLELKVCSILCLTTCFVNFVASYCTRRIYASWPRSYDSLTKNHRKRLLLASKREKKEENKGNKWEI